MSSVSTKPKTTKPKSTRPKKKNSGNVDDSKLKSYIFKVLKQVHPDTGITAAANSYVEDLLENVLKRIMNAANLLVRQQKKKTITSREIQGAVRLVIPGELAKHAVSEGTKAVTKFNSSLATSSPKGLGKKAKAVSTSLRSGIVFPVGRIKRFMKSLSTVERIGTGAPIYLSAVLEYIAAEILELAGNSARDFKKKRISIRHLQLTIDNDEELAQFFKGLVIGCKAQQYIHSSLLPAKKTKKNSEY